MLSEEAIRARVNLDDPQEQFRLETLVQDAARALSPDAVRVGIQEHRKHSQWMPALCDLVQHSKEWRRDRQDDAHRQSLAKETAERRALPAPKWTAESEAAWREKFARLLRELQAAPGPESARATTPPPPKDWSKPPAESDLSPELRAFAMERGLAQPAKAA